MNKTKKQALFARKLKEQQKQFVASIPKKIEAITQQLTQLSSLNHAALQERMQQGYMLLHTLSGSAGTFGCPEVGQQSKALEKKIKQLKDTALTPQDLMQIELLLKNLTDSTNNHTHESLNQVLQDTALHHPENLRIILVEDDAILAELLTNQLTNFGYQVTVLPNLNNLESAIVEIKPNLVICDIVIEDDALAGTEALKKLIEKPHIAALNLAIIFISGRDDMEARLEAVRAKCAGYFHKPINIPLLMDKVYELTTIEKHNPYQILIVDDDVTLTNLMKHILEHAGMEVAIANDPFDALQKMEHPRPDLILMDVHMPKCSGTELAQVIRQHQNYLGIPILFLSADDDKDLHMSALIDGGDDFITKPIQPDILVSITESKAYRSRQLNRQMTEDSLTGLYNHSFTENEIEREINRADRTHRYFSLAMIDLDFFKAVNDTYGHGVGDEVLRSLSYLLKKRLRLTDVIGRYGGEEFLVVMPETSIEDAVCLINEIKDSFSAMPFFNPEDERVFYVTLSAGIASFPECHTREELMTLADQALYQAKEKGRNQVVCATPYTP